MKEDYQKIRSKSFKNSEKDKPRRASSLGSNLRLDKIGCKHKTVAKKRLSRRGSFEHEKLGMGML
mgnify:CR=1 FL=1